MIYVDIDGWKISKMTLGTVQLGLNYGITNKTGKPSMEKAFEILDTAIEGGVNSFDTANKYGDSEEVLGKYFSSSQCEMKKPFFTTKFGIDPSEGTDRNSFERQIYAFVENSLEKLKIKKIPVYMLHHSKDMYQYGDVVPETLKKLKNEGLIEKVGVSVYNPEEVEEMLQNDLYEAVQIPMNVFDLRMIQSGVMNKLKEARCIVFVRSVFLQGLFFIDLKQIPEELSSAAEHLKKLHKLAEQEGLSAAQLAISFIRDLEGVTSVVLGAETPEQVAGNIRLMDGPKLSSDAVAGIEKLSAEVPIETIMNEFHARWRRK